MQRNETPLHRAALNGKVNAMKILLDHGANPNALDTVSLYLLHIHTLIQTHLGQWINCPDC